MGNELRDGVPHLSCQELQILVEFSPLRRRHDIIVNIRVGGLLGLLRNVKSRDCHPVRIPGSSLFFDWTEIHYTVHVDTSCRYVSSKGVQ